LVHGRWARKATLNKYGSCELRRYESLGAVTTPLTEATTPVEQAAPSLTLVTLTPAFYGAWIGLSDELDMTSYDPLISEISGVLGEQAGVSADTLIRNDLTAGATKDYSGDQTARADLDAPTHNITYQDFLKAYTTLLANDALAVEGERFPVIMHPHTYASLMDDPTFVNLFEKREARDDQSPMRSGFMGTILNCDVYVSSNARKYADGGVGTDDVYSLLFIGRESYGIVGMSGIMPSDVDTQGPDGQPLTGAGVQAAPVSIIVKQLGSAGADDPLDQRATIGWKMALDIAILQANFVVDLEHTNIFSED
jgi:N4-gp56 family major capsid protein